MKTKLTKLLEVKSIVTIATTAVFCYLSMAGKVTSEQFMMVFTTVIAFYFGTQATKNTESREQSLPSSRGEH